MSDDYTGHIERVIPVPDPQATFSDPALDDLADGPAKDLLRKLAGEYGGGWDSQPLLIVRHPAQDFDTVARAA
jgi:hypothetical protein